MTSDFTREYIQPQKHPSCVLNGVEWLRDSRDELPGSRGIPSSPRACGRWRSLSKHPAVRAQRVQALELLFLLVRPEPGEQLR